jgi:RNA polymerase sigma-70 factor (ECF subfamily)
VTHELSTTSLLDLIGRYQQGDATALDELIRRSSDRLERLARKMLRGFPLVRRMEGTDDVLQNSLLRLIRSLRSVSPPSTSEYFRLAALQIRRELLLLAERHRRYAPVRGSLPEDSPEGSSSRPFEPTHGGTSDTRDLDRWSALHQAVEHLPVDLREVFSLTFYYGATQPEIARLLGVSVRQVRRMWRGACLRLNEALGGDTPG